MPVYDVQLSSFHSDFECDLQVRIDELPLGSGMCVLDLACGDGFYTRRIAERLGARGVVIGADINRAYLSEAREDASRQNGKGTIDFVMASFDCLPFPDGAFDLVWCAKSLYTLPVACFTRVATPVGRTAIGVGAEP